MDRLDRELEQGRFARSAGVWVHGMLRVDAFGNALFTACIVARDKTGQDDDAAILAAV